MKKLYLLIFVCLSILAWGVRADNNALHVFTWEGYVTDTDITAVNQLLEKAGNPTRIEIIKPWAEGPDQMFDILRSGVADLSFLTLNYIKMNQEKTAKLLQPIDTNRLANYAKVLPALRAIPMGMMQDKPLYIPFGGGAYGIWANTKKISSAEMPKTLNDLFDPKWKGKLSLTRGQIQPNIAIALMSMGKPPFHINDLLVNGKREEIAQLIDKKSELQTKLNQLYGQVGAFWDASPTFPDNLTLVASYGIEIASLLAKGEKWELVNFKEGNTVWMDTMNIHHSVTGNKLQAAYVFIDYFLTPAVQNRVVNGLSMVAVTNEVKNPLIEANPNFFDPTKFWPPYVTQADNTMKVLSNDAMKQSGHALR